MNIQIETTIDSGTPDFAFSIRRQEYFERDGEKVYIGEPQRLGVAPGDRKAVRIFAPELLPVFERLWTEEIIKAFEAKTVSEMSDDSANA
ncbi:MAG: hypothetical protein FWE08_02890 [Oscillospiraceae bacterium]|nr:hypothetical protein [Oscillospiraceae bacterium]